MAEMITSFPSAISTVRVLTRQQQMFDKYSEVFGKGLRQRFCLPFGSPGRGSMGVGGGVGPRCSGGIGVTVCVVNWCVATTWGEPQPVFLPRQP